MAATHCHANSTRRWSCHVTTRCCVCCREPVEQPSAELKPMDVRQTQITSRPTATSPWPVHRSEYTCVWCEHNQLMWMLLLLLLLYSPKFICLLAASTFCLILVSFLSLCGLSLGHWRGCKFSNRRYINTVAVNVRYIPQYRNKVLPPWFGPSQSWTLKNADQRRISECEIRTQTMMLRVNWTDSRFSYSLF